MAKIDFGGHKEELALANPAFATNDTPEDTQLFEVHIEALEWHGLSGPRGVNRLDGPFQGIEREPVQTFPEGKAVAFGEVGCSVEGPGGEFGEAGKNGWFFRGYHGVCSEIEMNG